MLQVEQGGSHLCAVRVGVLCRMMYQVGKVSLAFHPTRV